MSIQPISNRALTQPPSAEDTSVQKNTLAEVLATLAEAIQQSERLERKRVRELEDTISPKRVCLEPVEEETGAAAAAHRAHEVALEALLEVCRSDDLHSTIESKVIERRLIQNAIKNNFIFQVWSVDHFKENDTALLFEAFANHSGPCAYLATKLFLEADPATIDEDILRRLLELISDEEFVDYILQKHNNLTVNMFEILSDERQELAICALKKFKDIAEQLEAEGSAIMNSEINDLEELVAACKRLYALRQGVFLYEEQESDLYLYLFPRGLTLDFHSIEERLAEHINGPVEEGWMEELIQEISKQVSPPLPEALPDDGLYHLFCNIDRGNALAFYRLHGSNAWNKHPITEQTTREILAEAHETDHQEFCGHIENGDVLSYALEKESNHDLDTFPKEALAALLDETISMSQFTSAVLAWEAISTFNRAVRDDVVVVDYQSLDEQALPEALLTNKSIIDPSQTVWSRFLELMNDDNIPESEKKCLVIRMEDNKHTPHLHIAIANSGLDYLGVFNHVAHSRGICVVPSFTMIQAMLVAEYGDNAVLPRPVLGQSSMSDIHCSVAVDEHDMGMGYPGLALPGQVDGRGCDRAGYSFSMHDVLHCRLASAIPPNHRQFFVSIASLYKVHAEGVDDEKQKEDWLGLAWHFVDMIDHSYEKDSYQDVTLTESNFRGFLNAITLVRNSSASKKMLLDYLKANKPELIELIGSDCYRFALEKCE